MESPAPFRKALSDHLRSVPKHGRREVHTNAIHDAKYWKDRSNLHSERQGEHHEEDHLGLILTKKTLYHGSGINGISLFQPAEEDTVGRGIYFTSGAEAAIGYATLRAQRERYEQRSDGKAVLPDAKPTLYEISIEHARLCDLRTDENITEIMRDFSPVLVGALQAPAAQGSKNKYLRNVYIKALDTLAQQSIGVRNLREITWSTGALFSEYLQSRGYDGLVTIEGGEDINGNHDTYVLFDPTQITIHYEQTINLDESPLGSSPHSSEEASS